MVDPTNPKFAQHQRLRQITDDVCDAFKNSPEGMQPVNGKWFVTKAEWMQIPVARRGEFYTFTNQQIKHAIETDFLKDDRVSAVNADVQDAAPGEKRQLPHG